MQSKIFKFLIYVMFLFFIYINISFSFDKIIIYNKNNQELAKMFVKYFDNIFTINNGILISKNNDEKIEIFLKKEGDIWLMTKTSKDKHLPNSVNIFNYYHIYINDKYSGSEKFINDVDGLICLMQYAFSIDLSGSEKCIGQTLFMGTN